MNKSTLLIRTFIALIVACSIVHGEERFAWEIEPLRLDEQDNREGYIVSVPSQGLSHARVFSVNQSGLEVVDAEERAGSLQAVVWFPLGMATRLTIQTVSNKGVLKRSQPKLINGADDTQVRLRQELEQLARKLLVLSAKIKRQDQYLAAMQVLPKQQQELMRSGVTKRLEFDRNQEAQDIKDMIASLDTYFAQLTAELDRLSQRSETARRALELRTSLDGYRSLLEAMRHE